MGIRVQCPKGHVFKVKDKYAGKKGRCPYCNGRVLVQVPDLTSTTSDAIKQAELRPPRGDPGSSSIFNMPTTDHSSSSGSLLSGSFVQHKIVCAKCGQRAPMWYARCPKCGEYLDHR